MGENDEAISLLGRALEHIEATAKYSVFYGEGRDSYDEWGRTAHESVFNPNDGRFRCPNSQQGYSGFTTWTRGLAWAMVGFPEQLEFLETVSDADLDPSAAELNGKNSCSKPLAPPAIGLSKTRRPTESPTGTVELPVSSKWATT